LSFAPDLVVSDALSVSARWSRSVRLGTGGQALPPQESWRGFVDWTPALIEDWSTDAHGSLTVDRTPTADAWRWTYAGTVGVRPAELSFLGGSLRPRIDLQLDGEPGSADLVASLDLPVQTGGLRIAPRFTLDLRGLGGARQERTLQTTVSIRHGGIAGWTPRLTASARWQDVLFVTDPRIEPTRRRTATYTVDGGLLWAVEGSRNDLAASLSWVGGEGTTPRITASLSDDAAVGLSQLVDLPDDAGPLWQDLTFNGSVHADGTWSDQGARLEGGATLGADMRLAEDWGASLSLAYTLSKPLYRERLEHGLLISLTVRVEF
jgi:hypothetical protein